ncbi:3-hydroxyacyl-CoA dehydrogenase [Marinicella sp. W31]|uniref:3-hydroxyacyl-CoA dehydrogenase n=1 Tax=Marinicella sp. W31 TaxID=3023713 RepID=UPI003756F982
MATPTAYQTVAVIGAGTMGIGIAEVAAQHGHQVLLYDLNQDQLQQALMHMQKRLNKRVERGKISAEQVDKCMAAIQAVQNLEDLEPADLVIEAIIEDLAIKQKLFAQLESICSEQTVLASNTSSISITAIAGSLQKPERFIGIHFFNPAPVMKLVEVISGRRSAVVVMDSILELCQSWGKVAVAAKSTPGFIVNRVARPFYGEPLKLYQEGLAEFPVIDTVLQKAAGFRMGPFTLMDLIGVDINFAVSQTVYAAMFNDPRYRPSLIQSEMVAAGLLGRKSGAGFYTYGETPQAQVDVSETSVDVKKLRITINPDSQHFSWLKDTAQDHADILLTEDTSIAGLRLGDCEVRISDGRTANTIARKLNEEVALLDFSFDYNTATHVHVCFSDAVKSTTKNEIIALFQSLNKAVIIGADQPGMIAMRTVAMLINEAADAVFNGVCSEADVDQAMRYGVNYPAGLLATGEQLGWQHVATVLKRLQKWFGDDRYRLSPWIRNQYDG